MAGIITDRWASSSSCPCCLVHVWTSVSWARLALSHSSAYTRASDPSPQTYPWTTAHTHFHFSLSFKMSQCRRALHGWKCELGFWRLKRAVTGWVSETISQAGCTILGMTRITPAAWKSRLFEAYGTGRSRAANRGFVGLIHKERLWHFH